MAAAVCRLFNQTLMSQSSSGDMVNPSTITRNQSQEIFSNHFLWFLLLIKCHYRHHFYLTTYQGVMSVPAGVTILLIFSKITELRDFMEIHQFVHVFVASMDFRVNLGFGTKQKFGQNCHTKCDIVSLTQLLCQ